MDAPICIAVCVDPEKDAFHFVEDGTTATQNMALAAQSLGLSTSWMGVFSISDEDNSTERKLKEILEIPKGWRLISILPLGVPKTRESKTRKALSELVDLNHFAARGESESKVETSKKQTTEIPRRRTPVSAREIEPALV
jgi:hypothetical protein